MDGFAQFFGVFGFVGEFDDPLLGALVYYFVIVFLLDARILNCELFCVRTVDVRLFVTKDDGEWNICPECTVVPGKAFSKC